ncbi:ROK family protein [uncultured Mucilaginibacter sp.]|uniref:ROK family protein n=1 Tax=uncultured Mucilaginibacter sp. TaxID=797541 RepID=UPI0025F89A54|nr:ROK family protein [uncultured Mucilaginibacter sp.]
MSSGLSDGISIGVDIGGSHITAAQVSQEGSTIIPGTKVRLKVDPHADAESVINRWAEAISVLCNGNNNSAIKVGIAMPGPFDYTRGISLIKGMNKYEALYGLDVRSQLSDALGIKPENILFRNDAEAFLHGEVMHCKLPPTARVIGVTLGTGLGSAKSSEGITSDVFRAITPMHDGIAEDYISTRWFQKRCFELTSKELSNVEALLNHDDVILKDTLFNEFGDNLGRFLNAFATDEQADTIIIGGNIAKSMHVFVNYVTEQLNNKNITLKQSVLWEDAALIGAACSWPLVDTAKGLDDKLVTSY